MKAFNHEKIKNVLIPFLSILFFTTFCCKDDSSPDRDMFIGSYTVDESCTPDSQDINPYNIIIQASIAGEDKVTIYNLNNTSQIVTASVAGSILTIPTQDIF